MVVRVVRRRPIIASCDCGLDLSYESEDVKRFEPFVGFVNPKFGIQQSYVTCPACKRSALIDEPSV
jgi:hypothetical protein